MQGVGADTLKSALSVSRFALAICIDSIGYLGEIYSLSVSEFHPHFMMEADFLSSVE